MASLFTYGAFAVLVVLPVAIELRHLPARLRELRAGWRALRYVPLLWALLLPAAVLAAVAAQYVPLLQWGWLGMNILVAPLAEANSAGAGGGGTTARALYPFVFAPLAVVACVLFNYYEEQAIYRERYRGVFGWAALHLVMGIPIMAVIPIFAVGVGLKAIYDRRGQRAAYVAHVGSNVGLLAVLFVAVV